MGSGAGMQDGGHQCPVGLIRKYCLQSSKQVQGQQRTTAQLQQACVSSISLDLNPNPQAAGGFRPRPTGPPPAPPLHTHARTDTQKHTHTHTLARTRTLRYCSCWPRKVGQRSSDLASLKCRAVLQRPSMNACCSAVRRAKDDKPPPSAAPAGRGGGGGVPEPPASGAAPPPFGSLPGCASSAGAALATPFEAAGGRRDAGGVRPAAWPSGGAAGPGLRGLSCAGPDDAPRCDLCRFAGGDASPSKARWPALGPDAVVVRTGTRSVQAA